MSDNRLDLSVLGLSADSPTRAALIGRVVVQYLERRARRFTIWRGIVDHGRPAVILSAAGVLVAAFIFVAAERPQTVFDASPRVPPAIARWMASPLRPGPLDVMLAFSETSR